MGFVPLTPLVRREKSLRGNPDQNVCRGTCVSQKEDTTSPNVIIFFLRSIHFMRWQSVCPTPQRTHRVECYSGTSEVVERVSLHCEVIPTKALSPKQDWNAFLHSNEWRQQMDQIREQAKSGWFKEDYGEEGSLQ